MRMINENEARDIAAEFLASRIQPGIPQELVVTDISPFDHCWVITFNSRRFVDTNEIRHALAGNGPLIVNRRTGTVRQGVASLPVETQLDED
jgi:hypothetical protein